ncbi:hypothetical protein WJX72_008092 [[Myrmecia] bisecta]|uniref:AB hydrolase-1 domain-containing protein n=1 Tax=[Myrmecia] bisecta TaxID=41462 RepID=A0AAW1P9A2_9CHLO
MAPAGVLQGQCLPSTAFKQGCSSQAASGSSLCQRPVFLRFEIAVTQRQGTCRTGRCQQRSTVVRCQAFPSFVPAGPAAEIQEPAAVSMLQRLQRCPTQVPSMQRTVQTAFVGPDPQPSASGNPVVLLHGFDSSCLEFRRLHPLLSEHHPTWAVDLVGWGFTDCGFGDMRDINLGPQQKRDHLYAFWKDKIQEPMILLGTSLGGAIAIDFALEHPDAVDKLVLVDAQAFTDGLGPMSTMPRFLAVLGVQVLRAEWLRQMANKMAYYDKDKYATDDARRIGRLHTYLPGWADANVAFMRSGGYALSQRVASLTQDTLVVWGANDEILSPDFAKRFTAALPGAKLELLDACGHCGHLEQPQRLAEAVRQFVQNPAEVQGEPLDVPALQL